MLCQDCSFIAHTRCSENARADCDIRVQLQLYARFSTDLPASPPVTPSPLLEPATPPTPVKAEPPAPSSSPSQSGIHRIFSRKKSKTNYHEVSGISTPPVAGSSANVENSKRTFLFGRARTNRADSNRNSIGSEPNSSSLRSQANRNSAILNGSAASPVKSATPLPIPPPKDSELPSVTEVGVKNAASRFRRASATPVPASDSITYDPRAVKTPTPDDQTYARRRKRLTKTESQTSKSGCTTQ